MRGRFFVQATLPGLVLGTLGVAAATARAGDPPPASVAAVDFHREVRPILAENCLLCHGHDARDRKSNLRFDEKDSPFRDLGGYAAIVPGKSDESRLIQRIASADHRMPPPESGKKLTDAQISTLRRWIDQGAPWKDHWAYVAPERAAAPIVSDANWVRDPIDSFVLRKLDEAGIRPNPEADAVTLLRRLTLDLTGVPPTPEEIDAFLADATPDAYETVVERLFESPRHAERMAKDWLDAARYGDTHGYHLDNERKIWRYRDWVIDAFRKNLPFDRFTIEQIAGDLLPESTFEQKIATGFLRCNPTTAEGGLIEEEYLVKYAIDRVETVSTVWLGSTLACAQCHDHKYDPFNQKEFYRFFAFFNNIAERGTDENIPNPAPFMRAPTPEQTAALADVDTKLAALRDRQDAPDATLDAAEAEYAREWSERIAKQWEVARPDSLTTENGSTLTLQDDGSILPSGANPDRDAYTVEFDTGAESITALRLESLRHESFVLGGIGRADNSNFVLTNVKLEARPRDLSRDFVAIPLGGAVADFSQPNYPITDAIDADARTGWAIEFKPEERVARFTPDQPFGHPGGTRVRVTFEFHSVFPRHSMGRFRLAVSSDPSVGPVARSAWHVTGAFAAASFDAAFDTAFAPETSPGAFDPAQQFVAGTDAAATQTRSWLVRDDIRDGQRVTFEGDLSAVYLHRTLTATDARKVDLLLGSDDAAKVWLNGTLVHSNKALRSLTPDSDRVALELRAGANELLVKVINAYGNFDFESRLVEDANGGLPIPVARALATPADRRDAVASLALRRHYRAQHSEAWRNLENERVALDARRAQIDNEVPTTLVAAESAMRREAHLLIRGQYDRKGEPVSPSTPAVLPPLPADRPADRLALATWLVDRKNPLTARVTMNRLWQRMFGTGLVETVEDFGLRGSPPSHPELLDWLAVEFMESGWDLRHMMRLIVTSSAYREASTVTLAQLERDPKNRLLARGARFRLDAEAIRDSALFASGLLVERLGGPSVKPYQPDGIWQAVAYPASNTAKYERESGEALYRRSLYTFWKRTAPPPSLAAFDAPSREHSCVLRPITNTPLQALALLNDVQYVEAARALAERILKHGGGSAEEQLVFGFRVATSRPPDAAEIAVLKEILDAQREAYRAEPAAAMALLSHGDAPRDAVLDPVEHAAFTVVANLLLNLDETITRG